MRRFLPVLLFLLVAAVITACTPTPKPPLPDRLVLTPVGFDRLPGWTEDDHGAAWAVFRRSCAALAGRDDAEPFGPDSAGGGTAATGTVADWRPACAAADAATSASARSFFETAFQPFSAANNDRRAGLFTGYYEPELRGSRRSGGAYATPLLRRPPDLVSVDLGRFRPAWKGERTAGRVVDGVLAPYPSRAEISAGALAGCGLELVWIDDPVDAFFLQIQGSGRVVLADGGAMQVGFDGQNGHPYVPIGRILAERGELPRDGVTMQSIRRWLADHPDRIAALLAQNPSYVFFRELPFAENPIGTQGVELTPGRSLAVDRGFVPLGVPLWLDLADAPDGRRQRLVIAQDTGGAIRGPVRGDLFWGHGDEAAAHAGMMRTQGEYYLLLPRSLVDRLALETTGFSVY
ncbi:MAG TPA: MltA domain-containing protein [Stellaceae bacterium]